MQKTNFPKLESKRILLRKLEMSDINDIVEGLDNENVAEWLYTRVRPFTKDDAIDYINSKNENDKYYHRWGIVLKKEKKLIGAICLKESIFDSSLSATTEIWINEKYGGREFGLEAECLCVDFAFNNLGIEKMTSTYSRLNIRSKIMNIRAGFKVFAEDKGMITAFVTKNDWEKEKINNPYVKKYLSMKTNDSSNFRKYFKILLKR